MDFEQLKRHLRLGTDAARSAERTTDRHEQHRLIQRASERLRRVLAIGAQLYQQPHSYLDTTRLIELEARAVEIFTRLIALFGPGRDRSRHERQS